MARLARLFLTLLLFAPACDDPAYEADLQDDSRAATSESEPVKAIPRSLLECELDPVCDHPFAGFDDPTGAAGFSAGARCIFEALAAGEPGLVETVVEFIDATARLDYAIVEPGVALRQASGESDAGGRWQNGVDRCQLQPPTFFADCLKAPSPACFDPETWVVGCEPLDNLVCPG
jgi:hypothetical protein